MPAARYERYVAIGDSTTEGLDDPDATADGGYRGWANRLAEHVAAQQPAGTLAYANLAIRGMGARQIKDGQLAAALALRPDLATVVAGMNDLLRVHFDARAIAADIGDMQRALVDRGCVVLTFTIPDIASRLAIPPLDRLLSRRTRELNVEIRRATATSGARLLDVATYPLASDPRMWSRDRLHANAEGHARIAAGLAQLLELPGSNTAWLAPLPDEAPPSVRARLADHATWGRDYFAPWLCRRVRGRSAGDERVAKRPTLQPLRLGRAPVSD